MEQRRIYKIKRKRINFIFKINYLESMLSLDESNEKEIKVK